jgi:hypothetical protein
MMMMGALIHTRARLCIDRLEAEHIVTAVVTAEPRRRSEGFANIYSSERQ